MKIYNTGAGLFCLYTPSDLARELGTSSQYAHKRIHTHKTLPAPTHQDGKRFYYTKSEFDAILEAERQRKEMLRT